MKTQIGKQYFSSHCVTYGYYHLYNEPIGTQLKQGLPICLRTNPYYFNKVSLRQCYNSFVSTIQASTPSAERASSRDKD
jgi:hypothetical protein